MVAQASFISSHCIRLQLSISSLREKQVEDTEGKYVNHLWGVSTVNDSTLLEAFFRLFPLCNFQSVWDTVCTHCTDQIGGILQSIHIVRGSDSRGGMTVQSRKEADCIWKPIFFWIPAQPWRIHLRRMCNPIKVICIFFVFPGSVRKKINLFHYLFMGHGV